MPLPTLRKEVAMSYTVLYKVPKKGELIVAAEFENSWQGAMHIWVSLAETYLGWDAGMVLTKDLEPLWALARDLKVPLSYRITLVTTFDWVMIKQEDIPRVVTAFREFSNRFGPGSLLEQADALEELAKDGMCYAVCWNQTTVNADHWYMPTRGDNYRLYSINKDRGQRRKHWFLNIKILLPKEETYREFDPRTHDEHIRDLVHYE
jgi:hypothetical protein